MPALLAKETPLRKNTCGRKPLGVVGLKKQRLQRYQYESKVPFFFHTTTMVYIPNFRMGLYTGPINYKDFLLNLFK